MNVLWQNTGKKEQKNEPNFDCFERKLNDYVLLTEFAKMALYDFVDKIKALNFIPFFVSNENCRDAASTKRNIKSQEKPCLRMSEDKPQTHQC